MPDQSTILSLPFIQPSQAQKHVTHNEAITKLDLLVQMTVTGRSLSAPPVSPAVGDRYIVKYPASGVWSGHGNQIALWNGSLWEYTLPLLGWQCYVAAESAIAAYNGAEWATPTEGSGTYGQLGISAVPDATNRLSVASPAVLFNHAGASSQVKINKAANNGIAGLLLSSAFSARAEVGLLGNNDFAINVSADGTSFAEALSITKESGLLNAMNGLRLNPMAADIVLPGNGTIWYNSTTGKFRARENGASVDLIGAGGGGGSVFSDLAFRLQDDADATKQAAFEVSGITTGTTQTYTLPNLSGEVAVLTGAQTFTGNKTFAGTVTVADANFTLQDNVDPTKQANFDLAAVGTGTTRNYTLPNANGTFALLAATQTFSQTTTFSGTSVTVGSSTAGANYGLGSGATVNGATKSVSIGTSGVAGSITDVTIGSSVAGALGTTTLHSPTVTFGSTVTNVAMPAAHLAAGQVGVGGATADATNRLAVTAPATLLNHAGAGHQVKVNKAAAADTASLLFQTGFSGRAEMGTTGNDDFSIKVSPNGSTYFDGLVVDRSTGRVRAMNGLGITPVAGDLAAPSNGDVWYNSSSGKFRAQQAGATVDLIAAGGGGGSVFSDAAFTVQDNADATKQAKFEASGIAAATTRTYTLPDMSGELALLGGTQTLTGDKTVSGTFTVSAPVASIGVATTAASYGLGSGATAAATTKAVNIGTAGVAGSTTNVTIGSAVSGALGTTVIHSPTVTFAASVTSVAAAGANVAVAQMGVGGATADAINRLSVTTPGVLFNHAGSSVETVLNKAAAGDNANLAFKTGFSTRAQLGLIGSDNLSLRVSPDGTSFADALVANAVSGSVTLAKPVLLTGQASDPVSPVDGAVWYNSTTGQLKGQSGGVMRDLDGQQEVPWLTPVANEYVMTTCGAGGTTTGTAAGAAGRVDIFPFIPRADMAINRMAVNVTTLIAAALGKCVIYASDSFGRPSSLVVETADMDFATTGNKTATVAVTLLQGRCYWIGLRHSSTATTSTWAVTATPDVNGGTTLVTTARKILRRTITYATGAPTTWGFVSSEINAAAAPAIWLRV